MFGTGNVLLIRFLNRSNTNSNLNDFSAIFPIFLYNNFRALTISNQNGIKDEIMAAVSYNDDDHILILFFNSANAEHFYRIEKNNSKVSIAL